MNAAAQRGPIEFKLRLRGEETRLQEGDVLILTRWGRLYICRNEQRLQFAHGDQEASDFIQLSKHMMSPTEADAIVGFIATVATFTAQPVTGETASEYNYRLVRIST